MPSHPRPSSETRERESGSANRPRDGQERSVVPGRGDHDAVACDQSNYQPRGACRDRRAASQMGGYSHAMTVRQMVDVYAYLRSVH
jgi:hypothetical protein